MSNTSFKIINARPEHASTIARFVMMAMTEDCCQFLSGSTYTYERFLQMMTRLAKREDTQYSYRNTLIATTHSEDCEEQIPVGICVSYDGALLCSLRKAFIEESLETFGINHSNLIPETQSGELYIDSLAVDEKYRGIGIASMLLEITHQKAIHMGLPATGLLVDKNNPNAEKLYQKMGFKYVNDTVWASHPMKHLQKKAEL